jgi:biopolymer transport protein ExbB
MSSGGLVMWVLFALNLPLWYGLGYRYVLLKRGTDRNIRRVITKVSDPSRFKTANGLIELAVKEALFAASEAKKIGQNCRKAITVALFAYENSVKRYSTLVKTIVIVAPLIGLLGTVMGMIETFEALQSSAMFSQGGSIAGGISKALFTTELGLLVAVPGLIIGRVLDKKEEKFLLEFEIIKDTICTKDLT